jgi:hypothetical protein
MGMRTIALAWLLCARIVLAASPDPAAGRVAIFLFGPAGAESARQGARAAAAAGRRWLSQPGSTAELRRAGSMDALPLDAGTPTKSVEQAFLNAARQGRDTDPDTFLSSLDAAAQSLARRPGLRLLVAVTEEPSLSGDGENLLQHVVEFCKSNSIRVVILDSAEVPSKTPAGSFKVLGEGTGGAFIRDPKALEANILIASAGSKLAESPYASAAEPETVVAANLPSLPTDLPVHTRFMHISPNGSMSFGTQTSVSAGRGGLTTVDGGPNVENLTGPMRGLFLVESPLSALRFDTDDNAGTYSARARVTQIARNASGKIVWQASKQVIMHGPLRKLSARREGNLYYLREVVLPAGKYTLEATVEDLIAGKSGGVREPLRTGMGTPGFTVSDALLVRPFNGAADKFEADQILQYDGNAISPLLDPEYHANEAFDLQIYLIIYPDHYGAQPQLSLEILRNGHVVGRSALPFTDKLRNEAVEGGGMSSMVGEQKHEFPYLATLRGVRFGPGEYQARITVRQGTNALTRIANFRVLGNAPGAVLASVGPDAAAAALAHRDDSEDDEDAAVTLPEVDPVHLNSGAAALPAIDQRRMWEDATASALSYSSHLPNFRCRRETRRLTGAVKSSDRFHETDAFVEELTYENGKETYRTVEVNGQKSTMQRDALKGVHSRGEFGSMLKSVFRPEIAAQSKWTGRAITGGVLCDVFDVDVPVDKSNFVLTFNLRQEVAGFHGRVFFDQEAGLVRRIVFEGSGLPKNFGLQSPTFSLEYGMVRIAGQDHLLPLRSVLQVREGRQVVRNETQFRDYRKFEASSEIKFE